jgi:uncharacterized protein (DUF2252 family)
MNDISSPVRRTGGGKAAGKGGGKAAGKDGPARAVSASSHPHYHAFTRPTAERAAAGKALRQQCPRKSQSHWRAPAKRTDPVELLKASSRGRLPHLLPIRYGRMLVSPFTFYRGAAAVMAHDLAGTPVTGVRLQACGDCHLLNFGGFATPERRLVFDINDFDETAVAPWEWDLKRLAASFVLAGRSNGFDADDCREAAWWAVRSYRQHLAEYALQPVLDVWYEEIDLEALIASGEDEEFKGYTRNKLKKASAESAHAQEFARLAYVSGDQPRIIDHPPLVYHASDVESDGHFRKAVEFAYGEYLDSLPPARRLLLDRFRIVDLAIKVVGVGSVGTECGIALLMSGNGDPLFLQFKEACASVLEPYAGKSPYPNHGQRVVVGQQIMQAASDIFLGWTEGDGGRNFYLRQLRDAKVKPVVETMKPLNLRHYAKACGWALARAHARSGDAVLLAAYCGSGDALEDALAQFAHAYADQTERDHALLKKAVRARRIQAVSETQAG